MKNTKKALLTSALCLLLCCSMLIGTTFAWFTDEVKSGNNIIQAGNLDVELEYAKVVEGEPTTWATVAGKTEIFNPDALWEPGHMEIVYLRVSNLGTLELKYQLGVNVADERPGITVDENGQDKAFKLSDYLVFKVVEIEENKVGTFTRENAIEADDELGLKDYNGETKALDPKGGENDMDYVALIVYMPTTVGNEANHKTGTDAPMIKLGINLFATQKDAESDSFGPDYDEDAWHPEMKVYSAQDLQAAINNGETNIVVMDDIVAEERIEIPADAKVTLDMNGHKLTTTGGNALYNQGNLTIIGTGEISSVSNYAIRVQRGSLIIDSADITVSSQFGAVSVFNGADVTINGGNYSNTGYEGKTSHTIYVGGYGTVNINGGTFDSGYSNGGIDTICGYGWSNDANEKAVINLNGGEFYPSELNGSYYFISNYDSAWTEININGGTYTKYDPAKISGTKLGDGYKSVDNGDGTYTVIFPQESFDKLIDNAGVGATIEIPAGKYTFPSSDLKAGQTLICAPGTVFEGNSKLNINGATVVGATFSNPSGTAVDQTINGTFKDCTFTGSNGLRWCYAGETVVFENCVFDGSVYGVHFDGGADDVIFRNCTFSGFNAMGGEITQLTMEGCTFKANGKSGYNGINLWGNTEMKDCTFVFDGSVKYEWVDACGDNKTYSFANCVVTDGTNETPIESVVGDYGTGNTIIVDGIVQKSAASQDDLNKAVTSSDNVSITMGAGNYTLPSVSNGDVTISGTTDTVITVDKPNYSGSDVTFNGVTIKGSGYSTGVQHVDTVTYNNATIVGEMCLYGEKVVFNNCTFELNNQYIWTYAAKEVEFNNCTFNTNGKAVLIYKEAGAFSGVVTINGCTFNATASAYASAVPGQPCAAVEIDSSLINGSYTVKFIGENVVDEDFSGLVRVKKGSEKNNVFIDGATPVTLP